MPLMQIQPAGTKQFRQKGFDSAGTSRCTGEGKPDKTGKVKQTNTTVLILLLVSSSTSTRHSLAPFTCLKAGTKCLLAISPSSKSGKYQRDKSYQIRRDYSLKYDT
jgi:hypothetical protein